MSEHHWARLGAFLDVCESPIEWAFAHAMLFTLRDRYGFRRPRAEAYAISKDHVRFEAQRLVAPYSLDFALARGRARIAVECDGAAFHAAEHQVRNDAARDRELAARGWTVLRFTGSRLKADAVGCAREAYAAAIRASADYTPAPPPRPDPPQTEEERAASLAAAKLCVAALDALAERR